MERYPDAKVILTVRPFDKWYTSIKSTIWVSGPQTVPAKLAMMGKMLFDARLRKIFKCIKFVKGYLWKVQFEGRFLDKDFVETVWNKHIEEVKATVPADKLLVYDVRDGWGPLCEFLGVPEPAEPLPHLNKKNLSRRSMWRKISPGSYPHQESVRIALVPRNRSCQLPCHKESPYDS